MRVYLIRHAQSFNNALEDLSKRVYDPELTELGLKQAEALAQYLKTQIDQQGEPFSINRIYASPMRRALQTAQPLARELKVPVTAWIALHELGGLWLAEPDGSTRGFGGPARSALMADFPGYELPPTIGEEGWYKVEQAYEPFELAMARAIRVASTLRDRAHETTTIALVSHAGFLDRLLKALLNQLPLTPGALFYAHHNTGITRIDFLPEDGMDRLRLMYVNRFSHLEAGQVSW